MVRSSFRVRCAVPADAAPLAALHARLSAGSAGGPPAGATAPGSAAPPPRPDPEVLRRLAAVLGRHDVQVQLAVLEGPGGAGADDLGDRGPVVVGVVVLRLAELVALTPGGAVHVEQLWVDPAWRRRGVGRALLAAVAATADHLGAQDIACSVPAQGREVHRFLARLGFGPAVTLRLVPVGRLRERLVGGGEACSGAERRRRAALDQLVARRRRQMVSAVARRAAGT